MNALLLLALGLVAAVSAHPRFDYQGPYYGGVGYVPVAAHYPAIEHRYV